MQKSATKVIGAFVLNQKSKLIVFDDGSFKLFEGKSLSGPCTKLMLPFAFVVNA